MSPPSGFAVPDRTGAVPPGPVVGHCEPGPTQSASERVAACLRRDILSGVIVPGQRLRQEDLAEQFGASRLPVREALRMLEVDGLVEIEVNRGARVPLLRSRDVDLLYQMRERLEPLALAESMARLDGNDLGRLHDLQRRIEAWPGVGDFLRLDREFHLLSYRRCDMEPLSSTVDRLWNATEHHRRVYMHLAGEARQWIVNAEHNLLLDALRRGDTVDAGLCLQGHIRRTRVELSHHPEIFEPDPSERVARGSS